MWRVFVIFSSLCADLASANIAHPSASAGRTTSTTNAGLEVAQQQFSLRGEPTIFTDNASHTVVRTFDPAGNETALTNRNGKKWQFQLDSANRLTNTITPLNRPTSQTWNDRGLPFVLRQPSGNSYTNFYDALKRLTNRTDALGVRLYFRDADGNITNVVEGVKTNSWTLDAYDRITSYKDADGNTVGYRTDANGNVTNLIYPGGKNVYYLLDTLNRITNVTDWLGRKTAIEYDLAGHPTKITRPNNSVRAVKYSAAGEATNIVEQFTSGFPIAFFTLNFDLAGRVQWEFAGPLPHAVTVPTRNMTYDDDNRLATFQGPTMGSPQAVTSDLDGNITYGPLTNDTFVGYTFNARNQLANAAGVSYGYDPLGNRTSITNGTNVIRFVINPNATLSQVLMRIKNGVTNYYVYAGNLGLLYEADDTGHFKTYHFDYRGSTVAIADDSGNITDRIEYSAYGTITYRAGTNDTPFLFNGRYGVMTEPNGLLYMRARYYNAYICRFINADPGGFGGGLNFYAFADGNPVSLIDPFGLGAEGETSTASLFWDNVQQNWLSNTIGYGQGIAQGAGRLAQTALNYTLNPPAYLHNAITGFGTVAEQFSVDPGGYLSAAGTSALNSLSTPNGIGQAVFNIELGLAVCGVGGLGAAEGGLGGGTTFTHFTDATGLEGITGVRASTIASGDTLSVGQLRFGMASNPYMASAPGDIFVTDLCASASAGELNGIGVFGAKQSFGIQFSQETALANGVRPLLQKLGIFTIPGGTTMQGTFQIVGR